MSRLPAVATLASALAASVRPSAPPPLTRHASRMKFATKESALRSAAVVSNVGTVEFAWTGSAWKDVMLMPSVTQVSSAPTESVLVSD